MTIHFNNPRQFVLNNHKNNGQNKQGNNQRPTRTDPFGVIWAKGWNKGYDLLVPRTNNWTSSPARQRSTS